MKVGAAGILGCHKGKKSWGHPPPRLTRHMCFTDSGLRCHRLTLFRVSQLARRRATGLRSCWTLEQLQQNLNRVSLPQTSPYAKESGFRPLQYAGRVHLKCCVKTCMREILKPAFTTLRSPPSLNLYNAPGFPFQFEYVLSASK